MRRRLELTPPEYPIQLVRNDQQIYNCFYKMDSRPVGLKPAVHQHPLLEVYFLMTSYRWWLVKAVTGAHKSVGTRTRLV